MGIEEKKNEVGVKPFVFSTKKRYVVFGICCFGIVGYFGWRFEARQRTAEKELSLPTYPALVFSPLLASQIELWKEYEVEIPSGTFQMGCTSKQSGCNAKEQRLHNVELTHTFYMMKGEVSQGLWTQIMGRNPSYFSSCGENCPVEQISWNDAVEFSNRLNESLGLESCYEIVGSNVVWSKGYDCEGWRLPTEAEWEYAARGGESYSFSGGDDIHAVGWFLDNSLEKTHPACTKKANGYGLCDMSGNVDEWVWDRDSVYPASDQVDPKGGDSNPNRVVRGGSWGCDAWSARVFDRGSDVPFSRVELLGVRFSRSKF